MKDHFWTIVSATAEITLAVVVLTDLAWKIYVHRAPTEQDKFKKLRRGLGLSGVLLLSILAVLYMVSGLSPVALDSEGALVVGRPCLSVPKFRCYERIY